MKKSLGLLTADRGHVGYFELGIDRRAVGVPDTGTVACHRLSVSVMVGMSEGPRPPSGLFRVKKMGVLSNSF